MHFCNESTFISTPHRFDFYYGSFSGDSHYSTLGPDGLLTLEQTQGGNFSGLAQKIRPDREQWADFRNALETIGIRNWQPEYSAAHGCCGVTYWHLILDWDYYRIVSRGANAFPGGEGQKPTPEFTQFLDAIAGLVRITIL